MLHPWQIVSSRFVVKDRWLRLRADTCRTHDGRDIDPYYVLEKRDFVHTIPVLADGRIVLVRQYRHGAQEFCLEFPGGILDDGETPIEGARRELREECGAVGGSWSLAAKFFPNPARQTNHFHCFLAEGVTLSAETSFDDNEDLEINIMSVAEIDAELAGGSFNQATHIAAFLMARPRLLAAEANAG